MASTQKKTAQTQPRTSGMESAATTASTAARASATQPALDRRIQRTRLALRDALMQLMVERGWDAIDVQTLCERANIGRSTFYEHFPNKEELLAANFANLRQMLLTHQVSSSRRVAGSLQFVPGLVVHVHEAQEVFRALLHRRSGQFVQQRFRELLVEMVQAEMKAEQKTSAARGWQTTAQAHYLAGALFELLAWWLGTKRPHKPEEITALYLQWSAPVLAAGRV
jgi:AcrR family transcriptional regulator